MVFLFALTFNVIPLSIPRGQTILTESKRHNPRYPELLAPSLMIRMNSSGESVVVVTGSGAPSSTMIPPEELLEFMGTHFSRKFLAPGAAVFTTQPFRPAGPVGPNGNVLFPDLTIGNVVVSQSGNPYVSLEHAFDGAYAGVDRWSFFLQNGTWAPIESLDAGGIANTTVTAAANSNQLAFVEDFERSPDYVTDDAQQGRTDQDRVWIRDGGPPEYIGVGTISAVRNHHFVGYAAHYIPVQPTTPTPVEAFTWTHGKKTPLGHGVAWSVNSNGDVVGDDRPSLDVPGRPSVWFRGKKMILSTAHGSCFAINDRGQMVGDLATHGSFFAQVHNGQAALVMLDHELSSHGRWHIEHTFAIADDGSILALALSASGSESLVMLVPSG